MLITNKQTGVTDEHTVFFPNTSFPASGPTDIWLDKNGFRKAQKTHNQLAEEARASRNDLLAQSDWIIISAYERDEDVQTVYPEWVTYRQELRDITDQEEFPHAIQWPFKPEG